MKTKKLRKIPTLVLLLLYALIALLPAAKADAHLSENGSVTYAIVKDEDSFRKYIDHDGAFSSCDEVKPDESSNHYKIVVDVPGDLLICPLADYVNAPFLTPKFELYSNFKMTSQIATYEFVISDLYDFKRCHVEPGTYYYRSLGGSPNYNRKRNTNVLTVYIGFIPDDESLVPSSDFPQYGGTRDNVATADYIYVNNSQELYDYINQNGMYSLQTILELHELSKVYAVTFDEPGDLMICPMVNEKPTPGFFSTEVSIYTNSDLSSVILNSAKAWENCNFEYYRITVNPGTYYLRAIGGAGPSWGNNVLTVYLGFLPSSGVFPADQGLQKDDGVCRQIQCAKVSDKQEYFDMARNSSNVAMSAMLELHELSEVYSFKVDEPGRLLVCGITDGRVSSGFYSPEIMIYSNAALSSQVIKQSSSKPENLYYSELLVEEGTYYLRLLGGTPNGNKKTATTNVYIGFIPTSEILRIDHIETTGAETEVVFSIVDSYDPDQSRALVRVVPGRVLPYNADNQDVWHYENMDNAIESHTFIAAENGIYTARICGNGLETYLLTFEITGIGD